MEKNYNVEYFEKLCDTTITVQSSNKDFINIAEKHIGFAFKEMISKFDENNNFKHFCPICGKKSNFEEFNTRKEVLCPNCNSLERHRFVYLLFERKFNNFLNQNIKVLHFAPELSFYNFFTHKKNLDYYPVDFCPEVYEAKNIHIRKKVNMENIPYDDDYFDFIYNCHVLEHVPNDIKAMAELYRVLKKGGFCVVLVPMDNIPKTLEKEEYNTPELRKKYYGQEDHVRKYGLDFGERLESVGFNVEKINNKEILKDEKERKMYKLSDTAFICTK